MGGFTGLFTSPEINPINGKARTLPFFNVFNVYGRVFFFSWFGFFLAFWSWYAFPPLLSDVIAKDIHLSKPEIANSNIIALAATYVCTSYPSVFDGFSDNFTDFSSVSSLAPHVIDLDLAGSSPPVSWLVPFLPSALVV